MLNRIRIEVEASSPAGAVAELDVIEFAALQAAMAVQVTPDEKGIFKFEGKLMVRSDFVDLAAERLGRVITEEVIELNQKHLDKEVYNGRRVVQYKKTPATGIAKSVAKSTFATDEIRLEEGRLDGRIQCLGGPLDGENFPDTGTTHLSVKAMMPGWYGQYVRTTTSVPNQFVWQWVDHPQDPPSVSNT